MKYKEYVKAYKFLTKRLKEIMHDDKAHLGITFNINLQPIIVYITNSKLSGYNLIRKYRYFVNCTSWYYISGNKIIDSRITRSLYAQYYSTAHRMNGFTKEDFMKMWLDNAIKNTLYVTYDYGPDCIVKFLDKNDTVESLCVQNDMMHI